MRIAEADILIVPGGNGLDPAHWQARWADRFATGRVVGPPGPGAPERETYPEAVARAIMMATRPVVLVAHGLGVIAVAHTAGRLADTKVRGALLVAPSDVEAPGSEGSGFAPVPRDPLPFPSILVGSETAPNCTIGRAADFAAAWGSDFHSAGDAGAIDMQSGHGPWPEGLMMFTRLMQRLK